MLWYITINLLVSAILIYIIADDLRNYRIRNVAVGLLLCLFIVDTLVRSAYLSAGIQVLSAAILFVILLIPYGRGLLGGGDVKLLSVAILWLTDPERLLFTLFFFVLTLLYVLAAKLRLVPSRGKTTLFIPFAPSIAGAWLLTILTAASRGWN